MSGSIKKTILFIQAGALTTLLLSPSLAEAVEGELENVEENEEDNAWVAALALDRQGEAISAIDAYDKFIDRFPDSERVSTALERISALRAEVAAAEQELLASAEKELKEAEEEEVASAWIAALEEKERRDSIGKTQRGWGIALIVVGGVLGVNGVVLGGVTLSEYNDLKSECGDTSAGCPSEVIDENHRNAVTTNWLLGAGVVSLVTGIILYATAPSWEDEKSAVSAAVVPASDGNGAVVGVSGRF